VIQLRFIYTFDAKTKDALIEQGYALLYSNGLEQHPMWVLDNPSGAAPEIEGLSYALSSTITF